MDSNQDRHSSHSMDSENNEDTNDSSLHEILMKMSIGKTSMHENNMDSVDNNKSNKVKNHGHSDIDLQHSGEYRDHEQEWLRILHTTVELHNL